MELYKFQFHVMGGPAELQLYAESEFSARSLFSLIKEDTLYIEKKWSRYREDSIISIINKNAGGDPIAVDEETAGLLDYADFSHQLSNGLFDITSGVLRKVWDFKNSVVPSQTSIDWAIQLIGWDKVEWEKPYFRLPISGMEIDFGGLGKEYAVDRCANILLQNGVESALINLAGDLFVIGAHPDGTPWSAGIVHPRRPDDVIGALKISKGALATSGDYERFFELDGKRYCHILNPKTGWPVSDFQSVSVQSDSCLVAGTTATIAMLLGNVKGISFLKDIDVRYLAVVRNGTILTSDSLHQIP